MTCYLASEKSQPFSTISEDYFQRLNFLNDLPIINNNNKQCLFGEKYEQELCFYLTKHIEVNCDDRLCLFSEESQWTSIIQERLFLNKPVHFIDCNLHEDEIKEKLFSNKYDRIILFNCLDRINISSKLFLNLLYKSLKLNGKLLIIHREPTINTLPLPINVLSKWFNIHTNNSSFIKQIYDKKTNNVEIYQNIEILKFILNKLNWFSLIYNQIFYPLNLINKKQIIDGLRQLNETYFKYQQDVVEIHDRLLFIIIENKKKNLINSIE